METCWMHDFYKFIPLTAPAFQNSGLYSLSIRTSLSWPFPYDAEATLWHMIRPLSSRAHTLTQGQWKVRYPFIQRAIEMYFSLIARLCLRQFTIHANQYGIFGGSCWKAVAFQDPVKEKTGKLWRELEWAKWGFRWFRAEELADQ